MNLEEAFPGWGKLDLTSSEQKKQTYLDPYGKSVSTFICGNCGPNHPIMTSNDGNKTIKCGTCRRIIAQKN